MSQVPIRRPFGELDLCDLLGFEPLCCYLSTATRLILTLVYAYDCQRIPRTPLRLLDQSNSDQGLTIKVTGAKTGRSRIQQNTRPFILLLIIAVAPSLLHTKTRSKHGVDVKAVNALEIQY